jgi:TM2 domain-containing membrane protein YozV
MKSQELLLYAGLVAAVWLVFFRKTEKFCGGCGAIVA